MSDLRVDEVGPEAADIVLAVIGLVLVVATLLFLRNDREHEWRWYQAEFKKLVAQKYGAEKAKTVPSGLQQVWVPSMGRADRCVTCHQATTWKGFESAEHPWKTHPQEILKSHPPEVYGCTSCHGGQGYAVDMEPAHGPVHFWEEPMLGKAFVTSLWQRTAVRRRWVSVERVFAGIADSAELHGAVRSMQLWR